jgi:hypothetical protein
VLHLFDEEAGVLYAYPPHAAPCLVQHAVGFGEGKKDGRTGNGQFKVAQKTVTFKPDVRALPGYCVVLGIDPLPLSIKDKDSVAVLLDKDGQVSPLVPRQSNGQPADGAQVPAWLLFSELRFSVIGAPRGMGKRRARGKDLNHLDA